MNIDTSLDLYKEVLKLRGDKLAAELEIPQDDLLITEKFVSIVGSSVAGGKINNDLDVCIRAGHDGENFLIQSENITLDNGLLQLARLRVRTSEEEGLVLWLRFDEGNGTVAHDSSRYGNDGTLYNGSVVCANGDCPTWTDGKFGWALKLDGINDYVTIGDKSTFEFDDDFTVEVWIKQLDSRNQVYVNKWTASGSGSQWWLGYYQSKVAFGVYNYSTSPVIAWGGDIEKERWHHIVGVRRNGVAYVYINGEQKGVQRKCG